MASSPFVVDVTADTFEALVVDRSREVPVVVDFWAPWCGPCRALSPVLEKLAAEMSGAFVLAKINTDDSSELAQAFQVSGIPAVFAVKDGQVVNQFEGVLPESEVRKFLGTVGVEAADPAAEHAKELEASDPKSAVAAYRQMFADAPNDPAARVGLARAIIAAGEADAEADALLAPLTEGEHGAEAERLRAVMTLRTVPHGDAELAAAKAAGGVALGEVLAARGEYVPAMDVLLAVAEDDKALAAGPVRELMVKIFTAVGAQTSTAAEYRGKLRNLLY